MKDAMNDKLQAAISEAILTAAFTEAAEQEIAELEAMDIEVPEPTAKQLREIERAVRSVSRKRRYGSSCAWRAVAMVAIVFSIAVSLVMVQPSVRASVWDFVVSVYEKYITFDFSESGVENDYELGEYKIKYIPKGYYILDAKANPLKTEMIFTNGEANIDISLYTTDLNGLNFDYGQAEKTDVEINNFLGYLVCQKDSDVKWIAWGDESMAIVIRASLSEKEIIKIAKNIE